MAETNATEVAGAVASPRDYPSGAVHGGRLIRYRATITLAAQAAGTILLAKVPAGHAFAFGMLQASATLGTTTVSIGTRAAAAAYRAAAVHTATVPTLFGVAAAAAADPLAEQTDIIATTAVAALPETGTLVVDLYFSKA